MPKTFYIETMGCQMNAHDSDFLAQSLINSGFVPVDGPGQADVILVNTCVVRAKPEQKAYSFLGRASAIKTANPGIFIGIVGCLAQMKGAELLKRFPQLDLIMGPREISRFPEVVESIHDPTEKTVATRLDGSPPCHLGPSSRHDGKVTGYISIMEGCNNFCSYCIVPYVRGRETSRPLQQIMSEAVSLISHGVKEITLLGQNVNSYLWKGRSAIEPVDFPRLLRELSSLNGLLRLRFVTSHPKDLSDELISCFGEIPNLCSHIHLPFQAGSDRILKLMHRGYGRRDYLRLVQKLRAAKPNIAITSDVMVGFPSESDQDFEDTLDLIRRVRFDSLFSFGYSDRMGTAAEHMEDKISPLTKAVRLSILQSLQKKITLEKNTELEGRLVPVLVEGSSKRGHQLSGRTDTYKIVNFNGEIDLIGKIVNVNIERSFLNSLWGERAL